MNNKGIFLIFVLAAFSLKAAEVCAQGTTKTNPDSLWRIWQNKTTPDTSRLQSLHHLLFDHYVFHNPDSAIVLARIEFDYASQRGLRHFQADAYNMEALAFSQKTEDKKALELNTRALKIAEEIKDSAEMGICNHDIGNSHLSMGNYVTAYKFVHQSLVIHRLKRNQLFELYNLCLIAAIYDNIGLIDKSIETNLLVMHKNEEIGDRQIPAVLNNNLGLQFMRKGDTARAIDYFQKGLELSIRDGFEYQMYTSNQNLAYLYIRSNISLAQKYNAEALRLATKVSNSYGISEAYLANSMIFREAGKYVEAIAESKKALELLMEVGNTLDKIDAVEELYQLSKLTHNDSKALSYHEYLLALRDSLKKDEVLSDIQRAEFNTQLLSDSLAQVEKDRTTQAAHEKEVAQKKKTINIALVSAAFILLIASGLFVRNRHIQKSKAVIEKERQRSDNLLLNILPGEIARELKEKGKAEARDFDTVSILFSDFKGFTNTSEKLSAHELVAEINTCFEAFDKIMEKYKIEKIKTIGDAYMAAGGLPLQTSESVRNTVLAALEMQQFISSRKLEKDAKGEIGFDMRVGINTGPVVAGIVGVKKFQYDIWGDAVNTASRMESNGEPGKVNISQTTYEYLKDDPAFTFEKRGKIEAKGKGEVEMFFVKEKNSEVFS